MLPPYPLQKALSVEEYRPGLTALSTNVHESERFHRIYTAWNFLYPCIQLTHSAADSIADFLTLAVPFGQDPKIKRGS